MNLVQSDVLIIGCGIAGASAALKLSEDRQRQITVVTRAQDPEESNTRYAQGGIVTLGKNDTPELLVRDIVDAGAGLSLPSAAALMAQEGPALIRDLLIEQARVPFDRTPGGELDYGREAAHSLPRVLHVGDATGKAVIRGLHDLMAERPNIRIVPNATAVDLITFPHHARDPLAVYQPITCHGAYVFDQASREVNRFLADATVLATGGLGRIYRYTSNPEGARGDGLAMANRAGARVINAEYIQFHPTVFAAPTGEGFLVSEAVRGEGGRLLTPDGRAFMSEYAPQWKELAPRDIVARAIHHEMVVHDYPHVLLDISFLPAPQVKSRFPNIHARCLEAGFDITREPIPVVPAAHYSCGGVWTDTRGRTTIPGLYAAGETACTGVHGANRLASTSLLEGLVWGRRAAVDIAESESPAEVDPDQVPPWMPGLSEGADPALIWRDVRTIQYTMWHYVGLIRSAVRLKRALSDLYHLNEEIEGFYRTTQLSDALIGLRHSIHAALVVAGAAKLNRTAIGCHFLEDGKQAGVL
ncbi:MAG: FAD-dependent oxidoreductase [Anaerolineales bacterium]|nr:FAD-dependent oxidoreductase [Anaerolineales bacterium]